MSILSTLAICSSLTMGSIDFEKAGCELAYKDYQTSLQNIELSKQDREAITRVSYVEASNQGEAGLAGVVYTVLNRLISGEFGKSITSVLNAPRQFEPVHKVGGWKNLPVSTKEQKAKINTILNLALDGHLPDLTKGALFFQNPKIVALREEQGKVSKGLTHFGGKKPSIIIKDHAFYHSAHSKRRKFEKQELEKRDNEEAVILNKVIAKKHSDYDVFEEKKLDIFAHQTSKGNLLVSFK